MDVLFASAGSIEAEYVEAFDGVTGERLEHVIAASAQEGWVDRVVVDGIGRFAFQGDELLVERRSMPVRLRLKPDAPEWVWAAFVFANAMLSE